MCTSLDEMNAACVGFRVLQCMHHNYCPSPQCHKGTPQACMAPPHQPYTVQGVSLPPQEAHWWTVHVDWPRALVQILKQNFRIFLCLCVWNLDLLLMFIYAFLIPSVFAILVIYNFPASYFKYNDKLLYKIIFNSFFGRITWTFLSNEFQFETAEKMRMVFLKSGIILSQISSCAETEHRFSFGIYMRPPFLHYQLLWTQTRDLCLKYPLGNRLFSRAMKFEMMQINKEIFIWE